MKTLTLLFVMMISVSYAQRGRDTYAVDASDEVKEVLETMVKKAFKDKHLSILGVVDVNAGQADQAEFTFKEKKNNSKITLEITNMPLKTKDPNRHHHTIYTNTYNFALNDCKIKITKENYVISSIVLKNKSIDQDNINACVSYVMQNFRNALEGRAGQILTYTQRSQVRGNRTTSSEDGTVIIYRTGTSKRKIESGSGNEK